MALLNPNLANLERTASALEPLLPDLMFVGGTLTGLFVTDPAAGTIRGTKDVDVVAEFAETRGYAWVCSRMKALGFQPDSREGAPGCWRNGKPFWAEAVGTWWAAMTSRI